MAKTSDWQKARAEERKAAVKAQAEFDKAVGKMGLGAALQLIYSVDGCAHDQAHAQDADRLHSRWVYFIEAIDRGINYAQAEVDKWRASFDPDPAYAFEWATKAMEAAAKAKAWREIKAVIEKHGPAKAGRWLQEEINRGARWPSRSTSPTSNLMEQNILSARAEFLADYSRQGGILGVY